MQKAEEKNIDISLKNLYAKKCYEQSQKTLGKTSVTYHIGLT